MLPQELHRTLRLSDAQVHNALFEDLLDVVLLHENFTALQALIFFQSGGGGGGHLIFYLCDSGRKQGWTMRGGEGRQSSEGGVGWGGWKSATEERGEQKNGREGAKWGARTDEM